MNILGIIPARSKSKGIVNKNIKIINGKELIYYTIKRAKESKLINQLISSTDSLKYSQIFKKYDIWTPSLRPKKLSTDKSNIIDTLIYTTKLAEKLQNQKFDYVVLLQPSSPNRKKSEIDKSIKKIINSDFDSLISLSSLNSTHPEKMKKIQKNKILDYVKGSAENPPRQNLEVLYVPSGNLYIVKRDILIKQKTLTGKKQTFYLIDKNDYVNIDNNDDLSIAKIKLKNFK
jgi:CMP-N,N'-diacetyllegionaminic acid synthase